VSVEHLSTRLIPELLVVTNNYSVIQNKKQCQSTEGR